jgi:hypothetical protein
MEIPTQYLKADYNVSFDEAQDLLGCTAVFSI